MDTFSAYDKSVMLLTTILGCCVYWFQRKPSSRSTDEAPTLWTSMWPWFRPVIDGLAIAAIALSLVAVKGVFDIANGPKETIEGTISEVDKLDGHTLLRIETAERGVIKVIRPALSKWPVNRGPVLIQLVDMGGIDAVYAVESKPGD